MKNPSGGTPFQVGHLVVALVIFIGYPWGWPEEWDLNLCLRPTRDP